MGKLQGHKQRHRWVGSLERDRSITTFFLISDFLFSWLSTIIACYQWNYDPIFPSIYGYSIFYAIMSLQVGRFSSCASSPSPLTLG